MHSLKNKENEIKSKIFCVFLWKIPARNCNISRIFSNSGLESSFPTKPQLQWRLISFWTRISPIELVRVAELDFETFINRNWDLKAYILWPFTSRMLPILLTLHLHCININNVLTLWRWISTLLDSQKTYKEISENVSSGIIFPEDYKFTINLLPYFLRMTVKLVFLIYLNYIFIA